jgi:toxin-antitoxin system PIN domain toxin
MILSDVNVLLYAFRGDSPLHPACRTWLEETVSGPHEYGMSPQVLSSFIRIATHPKIYVNPSKLPEALVFANTLLRQPNCHVIQPGPRHWDIFTRLCAKADAKGNLVQDAWLAALAMESGCEWITTDRDFARFPGLRWNRPLGV